MPKRVRLVAMACALLWGCSHSSGEKGGLVSVSATPEELQRGFESRRFALLIGVTELDDDAWRPLRFAKKDAHDFASALRDPGLGHFGDVTVLTDRASTTRGGILSAARALAAKADRPDDIILVYVSAHGTLARDGQGSLRRYLVSSDAQMRKASQTALSVEELESAIDAAGSRRRVLVLATCHSGAGKSLLPSALQGELASLKGATFERPLEEASKANIVLSASDWGETAREDETLQNDVYTHFLVEGLIGGADRNGDGAVSATEAHDYARRHTWTFSSGRQRPSAELLEVGADPVLLSGSIRRTGQPELYSYAPRLDGFTVRIDGEQRGELPGGIALRPGLHQIELTKGSDVLYSDGLNVGLGERVDLERLVAHTEPSRSLSLAGGLLGFVDQQSRDQLFPAAPNVGVAFRADRALLDRVSVGVDLSGYSGPQQLQLTGGTIPFTATSLLLGASALYTIDWRDLSFLIGPRVAALWVQRSFSLSAYSKDQTAFTITPGAHVGIALHLSRAWEASLNGQAMLTVLAVDGQTRVLGFAGGWLAVGYRF